MTQHSSTADCLKFWWRHQIGYDGKHTEQTLTSKVRLGKNTIESESIVTNCDPGDAMDDIDIIFWESLPDISVELRTIGVFGLGTLGSLTTLPYKIRQNQFNWLTYWRPSTKFKTWEKICVYRSNLIKQIDFRKWLSSRVMLIHFPSGGMSFDNPAFLRSVDEFRKLGVKLKLMRCEQTSKM